MQLPNFLASFASGKQRVYPKAFPKRALPLTKTSRPALLASVLMLAVLMLTPFSLPALAADDEMRDTTSFDAHKALLQSSRAASDFGDKLDAWPSWGHDVFNSRFNPIPGGLRQGNVNRLELKWSFVFPGAVSASSQPAIVGDTLYVGSWNGSFYALNPRTGQQKWSYDTASFTGPLPPGFANAVRNGPAVADGRVYFGDAIGNSYALNARTGAVVWAKRADSHPLARLTASPVLWGGKVYQGISSVEAGAALDPSYPCCTFRGGVVALDAATGAEVWRYYTVPQPQPTGGVPPFGPSGGPVWSTPAVNPALGVLYIGTGQNYTKPTTTRTDAIIALDLNTGLERWATQLTPNDAWNLSCNPELIGLPPGPGVNCQADNLTGNDFDFGSSPNVFVAVKNGRSRVLVGAGQKSGIYHALDAQTGEIVWQTRLSLSSAGGISGIQWGTAWDGQRIYVGTHDAKPGTLSALDPATGAILWNIKNPADGCTTGGAATDQPNCRLALPAAVSVTPGLVFQGSWDGKMRAHNSRTGEILWQYDTRRNFSGANGVAGQGGSINGAGASIVDGVVYVNSGYQPFPGSGMAGNVLLAFALR